MFNPDIHYKIPEPDTVIPKDIEKRMYDKCKSLGMNLEKVIKKDPQFGKIDAWWIEEDDERRGLQICYREFGDEITQELQDDHEKGILKKELSESTQQALFINQKGECHLFNAKVLNEKFMKLQNQNAVKLLVGRKEWINLELGITLRIRKDFQNKSLKCVVYFQPHKWDPIATFTLG